MELFVLRASFSRLQCCTLNRKLSDFARRWRCISGLLETSVALHSVIDSMN